MNKISVLFVMWQLSLFADSSNYFQVIKPISSRYFTVIRKSGITTLKESMSTEKKKPEKVTIRLKPANSKLDYRS